MKSGVGRGPAVRCGEMERLVDSHTESAAEQKGWRRGGGEGERDGGKRRIERGPGGSGERSRRHVFWPCSSLIARFHRPLRHGPTRIPAGRQSGAPVGPPVVREGGRQWDASAICVGGNMENQSRLMSPQDVFGKSRRNGWVLSILSTSTFARGLGFVKSVITLYLMTQFS